jgi:hypothetical protein
MISKEQKAAIEQQWLDRAKAQDLKPTSMAYKRAEVEFFAGAMAALHTMFPNAEATKLSNAIPPIWVVNAISGRPIVERASVRKADRPINGTEVGVKF